MANIAYFRSLRRLSRTEFLIALAAFSGVLTFGVLAGVVIGVGPLARTPRRPHR